MSAHFVLCSATFIMFFVKELYSLSCAEFIIVYIFSKIYRISQCKRKKKWKENPLLCSAYNAL